MLEEEGELLHIFCSVANSELAVECIVFTIGTQTHTQSLNAQVGYGSVVERTGNELCVLV